MTDVLARAPLASLAWQRDLKFKQLASEYHAHHFSCKICIASGQGYGRQCDKGLLLWQAYQKYVGYGN